MTRRLSAATPFKSSSLKGLVFLRSSGWSFILCTDGITKINSSKFEPKTEPLKKENHEMTTFTAHVTTNASNFAWQKYSSFKNFRFPRFVAYVSDILPTFSTNRRNSEPINYPEELLETHRTLFFFVPTELFNTESKIC